MCMLNRINEAHLESTSEPHHVTKDTVSINIVKCALYVTSWRKLKYYTMMS